MTKGTRRGHSRRLSGKREGEIVNQSDRAGKVGGKDQVCRGPGEVQQSVGCKCGTVRYR